MSEHAAHDKTDNERSAIYRGASSDALCQERHDGLAEAIQTGDVERFLSYYSKDIDFHDWSKLYMPQYAHCTRKERSITQYLY